MNYKIKNLAFDSIVIAIIFLLTITNLGYPRIGIIQATIVHIPVIFAIFYYQGKFYKAIMFGLVFGISSLVKAWLYGVTPVELMFKNPFYSIVPRLVFACLIYRLYQFRAKPLTKIGIAFASSYLHSIVVFIFIGFKLIQLVPDTLNLIILVLATNSLVEAIITCLIVPSMLNVVGKIHS